ncbi:DUF433 domain-containing protein [Terrabacter sp. Root181]|uniref:DUF433 domain-containing protein n=1 Tax=Terrabacter sp. Root181 TaxID=1736484 RepID=UPI0006FB5592|nr:DUF433 domain-containing protein [Terrabacter sp. Root181]KRB47591.1 hypothetical protein ASD90_04470 [Terrabacter sp. Root181]
MYPIHLASKLSGASEGQLRHWATTGILEPAHGRQPRYLYSFRDIMALRTVARLRSDVPLQRIRSAFSTLSELDLTEHPSQYALFSDGESVFLVQGDDITDLVKRRRQTMLTSLADVMHPFKNMRGERVVDLRHPRENLEIREARLAGWPTIRGTRVPYDLVASLMEDVPAEQVSRYYPGVSAEAAKDARDFHLSVEAVPA